MRKVTISILTSVLIIFSPVLVQSQGSAAGGFRGSSFGGINGGSTVSGFRGGLSNGGVTSTFRGVDLGSSTGFVSSSSGQRGFDSRSSTLTRSSRFSRTSNLRLSNLNTHILTPRFSNANNLKARLVQPIDRFKGFSSSSFTRSSDLRSNSLRNKVITNEEGNTPPDNPPTSPTTTTEIVHWVDRRNGVMHFTNRISSIPKGEETTIVTGKKAVSTSRESNASSTFTPSQSSEHTLSSTSRSTVGLAMRETTNSINSDNRSVVDDKLGSTKIVFNFFFGSPFFVSPFGFNPFNSFFFNPFLFQSPFFPGFFNSSVFPPIAPPLSPLFNPVPFGTNFSPTPNAFVFSDLNIEPGFAGDTCMDTCLASGEEQEGCVRDCADQMSGQ